MAVLNSELAGSTCLSDDELSAFVAGEIEREVADQLAVHLDSCSSCRELVSSLARVERDSAPPEEDPLVDGQVLGRFTLVRPLGQGAMGEVWAARDFELDREVALKVLHMRASLLGSGGEARLRREAQAMARLDHPNVVTIYDLGAASGRVFCAMRLVDGVTLRSWLATRRPWREVLEVMTAAGRGLAAAHAAGLVHRDVKPENILIGRDGRALVTDFGLAKLSEGEITEPRVDAAVINVDAEVDAEAATDAASLTRTGALIGTPAYMAPEQLAGVDADAASDQFALCITIYEALFGVRPFEASTVGELAAAIARGPRRPPDMRGVPARVVRCLRRGLTVSRTGRWPSVAALIDELDRVLHRRRRSVIVAVVVAAGALLAGAVALQRTDPASLVRISAEQQIASMWNSALAMRMRTVFVATGSLVASERAERVIRSLDTYSTDWVNARFDAWSATHVRREQTAELLERRLACFDRLAYALGELAMLFLDASAAEVARSSQAVYGLEPIATCSQIERLTMVSPPPSTPAGQVAEHSLRELEALMRMGRHDQALKSATVLVEQAQRARDPVLLARARFNLGSAQQSAGKIADAERTLRLAIQDAADARDHYLVAESWLRLYGLTSAQLLKPEVAATMEPAVAAAVAQAGNDPRHLGDLAMTRGAEATVRGDFAAARGFFLQARDRQLAARGPNHPLVGAAEADLGTVLSYLGELDDATRALERSATIIRGAFGEHHPVIARAEQALASIAARRKDWAASERHHRIALENNLLVRGPDNRETAQTRTYLARALREQHRFDDARAELDLSRASLRRSMPPTHIENVNIDIQYAKLAEVQGLVAAAQGRSAAAQAHFAEAETLGRRTVNGLREIKAGALPFAYAIAETARMIAYRNPREALPFYDEALAMDVQRKGRDVKSDVETLEEVAGVAIAAGQPELALGWIERYTWTADSVTELRAKLEKARDAGRARRK